MSWTIYVRMTPVMEHSMTVLHHFNAVTAKKRDIPLFFKSKEKTADTTVTDNTTLPALLSCTEAAQVVGVCSERSAAGATCVGRLGMCCWAPRCPVVELTGADGAVKATVDSCLHTHIYKMLLATVTQNTKQ